MTMKAMFAAAAAIALAAPADAQTPSPAAAGATDPARIAAARALVAVANMRELMLRGMQRSLADMRSGKTIGAALDANPAIRMERAKNPQAWTTALARIGAKQAATVERITTDAMPEIEAMTVRTYAENFSTDELRQIVAFYGTPLGKMMLTRLPAVMSDTMSWTQSELPKRLAPAMAELAPDIERELKPLMPQAAQ